MSELHRKQKGNLGELAVAKQLVAEGFAVFAELGDNSRVDLIVLVENRPVRLQVKTYSETDGKIALTKTKKGPGYSFTYKEGDVDLFVAYNQRLDECYFIAANEFLQMRTFTLRTEPSRNNQVDKIRFASNYLCFGQAYKKQFGEDLPQLAFSEEKKPREPRRTMKEAAAARRSFEVSKEELKELLAQNTLIDVARKFNVSGTAIRRRCKTLGIQTGRKH